MLGRGIRAMPPAVDGSRSRLGGNGKGARVVEINRSTETSQERGPPTSPIRPIPETETLVTSHSSAGTPGASRRWTLLIPVLAVALPLAACDESSIASNPNLPNSIEANVEEMRITSLNRPVEFSAVARNRAGSVVPDMVFAWNSTNHLVLRPDGNGVFMPLVDGSATVRVRPDHSVHGLELATLLAEIQVTVDQEVVLVETTPSEVVLEEPGAQVALSAEGLDDAGTPYHRAHTIEWASEDEAVVTVDAEGVVTAVSEGVVAVTATIGGVEGAVQVTVDFGGND